MRDGSTWPSLPFDRVHPAPAPKNDNDASRVVIEGRSEVRERREDPKPEKDGSSKGDRSDVSKEVRCEVRCDEPLNASSLYAPPSSLTSSFTPPLVPPLVPSIPPGFGGEPCD